MALEVTGKVVAVLPRQEGESVNGRWAKQPFVIETLNSPYPKKICFQTWNERTDEVSRLKEGMLVTVSFDLESREYNGRWYTDARAWRIVSAESAPATAVAAREEAPAADDDLPF
ncbi:MAG: DUF3127 domain-containing protein [Chitinophagales bacterium]|nr:DUF3127 domain-containing protein [Chitinophagales bacterium]MDW8394435.1 DUF3127 domain-containing protein [Chitinophagales bacterium]